MSHWKDLFNDSDFNDAYRCWQGTVEKTLKCNALQDFLEQTAHFKATKKWIKKRFSVDIYSKINYFLSNTNHDESNTEENLIMTTLQESI